MGFDDFINECEKLYGCARLRRVPELDNAYRCSRQSRTWILDCSQFPTGTFKDLKTMLSIEERISENRMPGSSEKWGFATITSGNNGRALEYAVTRANELIGPYFHAISIVDNDFQGELGRIPNCTLIRMDLSKRLNFQEITERCKKEELTILEIEEWNNANWGIRAFNRLGSLANIAIKNIRSQVGTSSHVRFVVPVGNGELALCIHESLQKISSNERREGLYSDYDLIGVTIPQNPYGIARLERSWEDLKIMIYHNTTNLIFKENFRFPSGAKSISELRKIIEEEVAKIGVESSRRTFLTKYLLDFIKVRDRFYYPGKFDYKIRTHFGEIGESIADKLVTPISVYNNQLRFQIIVVEDEEIIREQEEWRKLEIDCEPSGCTGGAGIRLACRTSWISNFPDSNEENRTHIEVLGKDFGFMRPERFISNMPTDVVVINTGKGK